MQLVESKLYIANLRDAAVQRGRAAADQNRNLISRLQATSASTRLLVLMLTAFAVIASPPLFGTIRSAVALAMQILIQAGQFGLVAFRIFGR